MCGPCVSNLAGMLAQLPAHTDLHLQSACAQGHNAYTLLSRKVRGQQSEGGG